MHVADHVRPGDVEDVVVALQVAVGALEAVAAVIRLDQLAPLQHGAHGAVEHEDMILRRGIERGAARLARRQIVLGQISHGVTPYAAASPSMVGWGAPPPTWKRV